MISMPHKIMMSLILIACSSQAKYTVSGISSGGFMAAQMGVIYSSEVSGVGMVAAGFYNCAGDHFQQKLKKAQMNGKGFGIFYATELDPFAIWTGNYSKAFKLSEENPLYQSVAVCMQNPQLAEIDFSDLADRADAGLIDATENIAQQNIFLFQGQKDSVVNAKMQDQNIRFYEKMNVAKENITVVKGVGGHSYPTDQKGLNACESQGVPYLSSCEIDLAGDLLTAVLGQQDLVRSAKDSEKIYQVRQKLGASHPESVAEYGYLAAPDSCLKNPSQCRLHVALHGCEMADSFDHEFDKKFQAAAKLGFLQVLHKEERLPWMTMIPIIEDRVPKMGAKLFAELSGYGRYANEQNKLMVLFPQTWIGVKNYPGNPKGCWDWYGFTGSEYATKNGTEPKWLNEYIQKISKQPKSFIIN